MEKDLLEGPPLAEKVKIDQDIIVQEQANALVYRDFVDAEELIMRMRHIETRGVFDESGNPIKPYENANLDLVTVSKSEYDFGHPPELRRNTTQKNETTDPEYLWTPQPTIYSDQLFVMKVLDTFLSNCVRLQAAQDEIAPLQENATAGLLNIGGAVRYFWPGRGEFSVMPPVIEEHTYQLNQGVVDLDYLRECFKGCYVKDAKGNLHALDDETMRQFYIDHESQQQYLPPINPQVALLDYGRSSDRFKFQIICDGSHRIYHALEEIGEPIQAVHVTPLQGKELIPYYAVPRPFHPATRLSSKKAEDMYGSLENDKMHLLTAVIRKALHYDWTPTGLDVSSLRSKKQ